MMKSFGTSERDAQREIIQAWYARLGFPKKYDEDFARALEEIALPVSLTVEEYDKTCTDGRRNFLSLLYFCEETARRYRALGIPDEILDKTMSDLVRWTETWSAIKGELWLEELGWLLRHFSPRLFHIGRLQFEMGTSRYDLPAHGLPIGTPIIKIHIPACGKLNTDDCRRSVEMAKEFFATYFPDFSYACMTCDSWLLDDSLRQYLPKESNILRFADLFERVLPKENNCLIRYIFTWDTTEENLPQKEAVGGFAEKIKHAVLAGETFHETFGILTI